jgi:hypothetical protein
VKTATLGIIVGNRGFFPDHLADQGRKTILKVLQEEGINAVAPTPQDSKFGSVESDADAHKLADLFNLIGHQNGHLLIYSQIERRIVRWFGLAILGTTIFDDIVGKLNFAGTTPHKPMERMAVLPTSPAEPTRRTTISPTKGSSQQYR